MKYSQAIIVACIGGATLASAIPFARPSSDSSLAARGPKDTDAATTSTSTQKKWKGVTAEEKEALKAARKAKKQEASGSSKSSPRSVASRDFDEDLWARAYDDHGYLSARQLTDAEPPASTTPSAASAEPPVPEHASGSKHPGHGSGHKKWKDMTAEEKAARKDMTAEEKAARKAAKKAKKQAGRSSKSSSRASSVSLRAFEEDLWARDFDDYEYLSARGPKDTETDATTTPSLDSDSASVEPATHQHASGSNHPGHGSGHKKWKDMTAEEKAARRAAKKAKKQAGRSSKSSSRASSLSTRDFEDDLAARELLDEVYARDVEEYLEARGRFMHALGAFKDTITGKNRAQSVIADPYGPVARDFIEELDARDFDFEIDELD
ncbi:hypothetical protein FPV67DRAFT_1156617 [Lyophyllum atratum]|nr:hypothetical protein FPV67DRAFT_1156617 [Lyophyllum atratum]